MSSPKVKQAPKPQISARELCCHILTEAESKSVYLDHTIQKHLARHRFSVQDKALITAITNGTMRYRARLDTELATTFHKNYHEARPFLKNILRTARFQMEFMDRVPPYAIINEAVKITRSKFGERMARLCNAVLRNLQRKPYQWPKVQTMLAEGNIALFANYFSYPEWLIKHWLEFYSHDEIIALAESGNRTPKISIRITHPQKNLSAVLKGFQENQVETAEVANIPHFYKLHAKSHVTTLNAFQSGRITVQDPSAGLVTLLASPRNGESIIDLCAAPGGKTFSLAEHVKPNQILAVDKSPKRLRLLKNDALRLHCSVSTVAAEAQFFTAPTADIVLVDAPCSGLGVLARRSDLRWLRKANDLPTLIELQKKILLNAAHLVKPGGRLIYSTCTIEQNENHDIIAWFIEKFPNFKVEPANKFVHHAYCDENGFIRTLPHRHDMDGSFAARLVLQHP